MIVRRFYVSGRVQGVFFRGSTQAEARRLGLIGHAINLEDGRVEVLAAGSPGALDELSAWLQQGPRLARVEAVNSAAASAEEAAGLQGFTTG